MADFDATTGRFVRQSKSWVPFPPAVIEYVTELILTHRDAMNPRQFDVHNVRPAHHYQLDPTSAAFASVAERLNARTRGHPAVDTALEQLEDEDPAYRFTRDHMRRALDRAADLPASDLEEWEQAFFGDTWGYDIVGFIKPDDPIQTYEQYAAAERELYRRPEPDARRSYRVAEVYAVEGVPGLHWVECVGQGQHGRTFHGYVAPFHDALLLTRTPTWRNRRTYAI